MNKISKKLKKLVLNQKTLKQQGLDSTFLENFQIIIDSLNRNTMENYKYINDEIISYFKYISEELGPIGDLFRETENLAVAHDKLERNLKTHLAKTFTCENTGSWDLDPETDKTMLKDKEYALSKMLFKERKGLNSERCMYHYFNFQAKEQLMWFCKFCKVRDKEFFERYVELNRSSLSRLIEQFQEFEKILRNY